MKLKDINELRGKITLRSGLHIGAGDMEMHIGGTDQSVIKHANTQEPYIPGSSLKGKVRALIEMYTGLIAISQKDPFGFKHLSEVNNPEQKRNGEMVIKLFGSSGADTDKDYKLGPTRASFSDCPISKDWLKKAKEQDLVFTEVKSENSINRITGTAQNPRFIERVPAGVEFDFRIAIKAFEGDEDLLPLLMQGLKLLEMDALGGSGSRGYGRIKFQFEGEAMQEQYEETKV